jgi:hypothetical protein
MVKKSPNLTITLALPHRRWGGIVNLLNLSPVPNPRAKQSKPLFAHQR